MSPQFKRMFPLPKMNGNKSTTRLIVTKPQHMKDTIRKVLRAAEQKRQRLDCCLLDLHISV